MGNIGFAPRLPLRCLPWVVHCTWGIMSGGIYPQGAIFFFFFFWGGGAISSGANVLDSFTPNIKFAENGRTSLQNNLHSLKLNHDIPPRILYRTIIFFIPRVSRIEHVSKNHGRKNAPIQYARVNL